MTEYAVLNRLSDDLIVIAALGRTPALRLATPYRALPVCSSDENKVKYKHKS